MRRRLLVALAGLALAMGTLAGQASADTGSFIAPQGWSNQYNECHNSNINHNLQLHYCVYDGSYRSGSTIKPGWDVTAWCTVGTTGAPYSCGSIRIDLLTTNEVNGNSANEHVYCGEGGTNNPPAVIAYASCPTTASGDHLNTGWQLFVPSYSWTSPNCEGPFEVSTDPLESQPVEYDGLGVNGVNPDDISYCHS